MSVFYELSKEKLDVYEKQLYYLYVKAITIHEFCLSARINDNENKNELERIQLKIYSEKMKRISYLLENLIKSM